MYVVRVVSALIKINVVSNEKLSFSIFFFIGPLIRVCVCICFIFFSERKRKYFNVNTHQFMSCVSHVCVPFLLTYVEEDEEKSP